MNPARSAVFFLAIAVASCAHAADPADAARGRALYEASCGGCHNESVHNDASRKARNFEHVRARIADFAAKLNVGWVNDQVDDVTVYLNERYYSYPCPPSLCPAPDRR